MQNVLMSILNELDACIYVTDLETDEILFINRQVKESFGLEYNCAGSICWKVVQKGFSGRCPFCPIFQLEKDPDTPVVWEERNSVTDRYYRKVDSIIPWIDGKKAHLQYATDITDMLEAQNETRAIRERLEIALLSSQAGVWELSFDTDLLTYDAIFGILFGLDPQKSAISVDALIAHIEKNMRGETAAGVIKGLRDRDPYAATMSKDYHLAFPNGTVRYLRNFGHTARNAEGKALRLIGMCIDITQHVVMENELKAAKETAENANRAKSQFLSNMSHEIRTPMNAIIGMTEILLDEDPSELQRLYLNDIKVSSTSLLAIINDILDFSKIEEGKLQLSEIDYDLRQLLNNLESMFSFAAKAKNLFFELRTPGDLPVCLHGDDLRLRQALVNLLGNAIKFTKTGGVTLTVSADERQLNFEIRDTGIGIKPEDLPHIFQKFDQFDLQSNRTSTGTGLGLPITRSLVSQMGGSIRIESEYGKGTVFYLQFPLILGDDKNLDAKTGEFELFDAPDAKILVVDDNEMNLNVAAGFLKLYGIACTVALSGREAIELVERSKYDIIFMDHMMPEMDGIETTKILREKHAANAPVIIALTANAIEGAKEMLLEARMDDYLSKPLDRLRLMQSLHRWLPADKIRRHGKPVEEASGSQG